MKALNSIFVYVAILSIYGFGDTQIKEMMNKLGIKSFEN